MKMSFNMLSFTGLMFVSLSLSLLTYNVQVSEFLKSALFIALGFAWTSYYPVIVVEPDDKDKNKEKDDATGNPSI